MGIRDSLAYVRWREERAVELIGPYVAKSAGAFVSSPQRRTSDGWIYGGRDAFCFFADDPTELAYLSPPGRIDQRTLVVAYQDCEAPQIHSAPGALNLIVDFGNGREFAGVKSQMEQLIRLWQMWASGSEDPELWKQTADVSGLPLYSRSARIASNPMSTAIGFMLGLFSSILVLVFVLDISTPESQPPLATLIAISLVILAGLIIIGRWQPNFISGFIFVSIVGLLISVVVAFSRGIAATAWLLLLTAIALLVVRLIVARLAQPKY